MRFCALTIRKKEIEKNGTEVHKCFLLVRKTQLNYKHYKMQDLNNPRQFTPADFKKKAQNRFQTGQKSNYQ